jgi:tRNA dimethylallyltransferase
VADADPSLIIIIGPTAAGKSRLASHLARKLGGEIVGVDAVQVYRGLDAATAKPPKAVRDEIPHHLIDVADPRRDFSAGDYARLAGKAIEDILSRRRRPVLAGGTGLYLRALLRGLADMPPRQEALRGALRKWQASREAGALHRMLSVLDPLAAARIGGNDMQRIIRAIEVAFSAGRPLSEMIDARPFGEEHHGSVKVGITFPPALLRKRLEARVDRFFEAGLVEEVRRLREEGVPRTANSLKALGYREVLDHLDGSLEIAETIDLVKMNTRRYAKRQMTWFRREPNVAWFELGEDPEDRYPEIEALIERRSRAGEFRDGER